MVFTIETIIWYLLLIDSVGANITAWFFKKEYKQKFNWFAKHFPATKGWCLYYLILVLWVGFGLYRLGVL